jgi:hypothetical protein
MVIPREAADASYIRRRSSWGGVAGERLGAKSIDQQRGLMGGLGLIERTQWCGNRANPIYRLRRQI